MRKTLVRAVTVTLCVAACYGTIGISSSYAAPIDKPQAVTASETTNTGSIQLLKQDIKVQTIKENHAYIPQGTTFMLELMDPISSKKSKEGNTFRLKTLENILINDVVVIPAQKEVTGVITMARKNGMFGRKGRLEFSIPNITTINGVVVPLDTTIEGKGHSDNGAVAVAAAVTLIGGMFMKGTNISYNPGQTFEAAVVAADTDLDVTLDELPTAMNPSIPRGKNIVLK